MMTWGNNESETIRPSLPDGWKAISLSNFPIQYGDGLISRNRSGGSVPVYGSNGIVGWHTAALTHGPAIIIGRKGSVGAVHISDVPCWPIDTTYYIDEFPSDFDYKFLYYFLRSQTISDLDTSTAIPGINRNDLGNITIPQPPLDEQHRVVAKLEYILSQIRTARTALDRIPALLKAFRQSVLAAAFRGELTGREPADEPAAVLLERIRAERRRRWEENLRAKGKDPEKAVYEEPPAPDLSTLPALPEGWVWSSIGGIFDVILGGTPARDKPEYWNGEIPWVSSGEVAFCRITHTKETITRFGLNNSNAKFNPAGSVLLAMIGEGKTRGQAAILDIDATTNQNIAAIHCASTPVKAEWLFFWFMYQYEEIRSGGMGGAQPALNAGRVKALIVPIAPWSEMDRIIAKVTKMLAEVDTLEGAVAYSIDELDKIEQISLYKSFRGEL